MKSITSVLSVIALGSDSWVVPAVAATVAAVVGCPEAERWSISQIKIPLESLNYIWQLREQNSILRWALDAPSPVLR